MNSFRTITLNYRQALKYSYHRDSVINADALNRGYQQTNYEKSVQVACRTGLYCLHSRDTILLLMGWHSLCLYCKRENHCMFLLRRDSYLTTY